MKISPERLALTQELYALAIDYWHDVDTNWGATAHNYYLEDGIFVGGNASYKGREKIKAFYDWRKARGARTVVHAVSNFKAMPGETPDQALCHWFLMLYAADGEPVLPTHPPIQIAYMTDRLVLTADQGWKLSSRRFDIWFEGGTAATNPNLGEEDLAN